MEKINIAIIDDESEICDIVKEIIEDIFPNINCITFNHWGEFNEKTPNLSFIIADQNGVGRQPLYLETRILTFSGDPSINPDIPKPFGETDLIEAIKGAYRDTLKNRMNFHNPNY